MSKLFSYAIGLNEPLSLEIRAKGAKLSDEELLKLINKVFDFRVTNIIKELDLKNVKYAELSCYGHFGKRGYPWEEVDE